MTEEVRVTIGKARFGWWFDTDTIIRRQDGTEIPHTACRSERQHTGWRLTERWARRAGRAAAQRYIRYWTPAVATDAWIESGAATLHGLSIALAVALIFAAVFLDTKWPMVLALVVILPAFFQAVKREPDGIEERERVADALARWPECGACIRAMKERA